MRVHVESVDLGTKRDLVFAAVQLTAPDLDHVTFGNTYEWKAQRRATRIDDVRRILAAVCAPNFQKKPDIIIFPEYSIPKEAFKRIDFQGIANDENVIIVAGSYFDTDEGPTFRNNICQIFLPERADPIIIAKASASPKEKEILETNPSLSNAVRLLWTISENETVAINIFLCRDYLTPFEQRKVATLEGEWDDAYLSALDWAHEGINIVVMNNENPTLFEAAAAFDVRDMHGKRKLVLLVNSANHKELLATALLGASNNADREADVVGKLKSSEEAILVIQARLWNVEGKATFPDTYISVPVSHWSAYSYSRADNILRPMVKERRVPETRGIFHPAFLEAMRKDMVIEFFVAKSTQRVERAFKGNVQQPKIRHISASHVRGIEDFMIRRYVDRHTTKGNIPEKLSLPFCYLSETEFEAAFDTTPNTPHLKILVEPRHILKIRGQPVPKHSPQEWEAIRREILEALDYGTREREACALAKELPVHGQIPYDFAAVFSLGFEEVTPMGKEFQNNIREMYVLITAQDHEGREATRRFGIYVNDVLMKDNKVRDIYTITKMEPARQQNPFEFVLRLKCTAFEADDVIYSMQQWANPNGVRIGTRTYDLWRHLARNSIEGIVDTKMTESELDFLVELHKIESEANWNLDNELREKLAAALKTQSSDLAKLGKLGAECVRNLQAFYYNLALFNISSPAASKGRYVEDSQKGWTQLYKYYERWSKALLAHALGLPLDEGNEKIGDILLSRFGSELGKVPSNVRNDPTKMFIKFYLQLRSHASPGLANVIRDAGLTAPPRNYAAHGGNENLWTEFVGINGEDWETQFENLEASAKLMCKLLVELRKELTVNKLILS